MVQVPAGTREYLDPTAGADEMRKAQKSPLLSAIQLGSVSAI